MVKEYKSYFKIAMHGLLIIILLFLFYKFYFSDYMWIPFTIIILSFSTEKGMMFFRNRLSKKTGLIFFIITLILTLIAFYKKSGFDMEYFLLLITSVFFFFDLPFFILQWKNMQIRSEMPNWRDFFTIFFVIISYLITLFFGRLWLWDQFFILLFLILFLVVRNFSREDIGYKLKVNIKDVIYFFIGFLLILVLIAIWDIGIKIIISKYFFDYLYTGFKEKILSFLSAPVGSYFHYIFFVGLFEELVCRGLILGLLMKRFKGKWYGNILALLISSLVFGFGHYHKHGLYGSLWDCIIGLVLGIIFIKTKRLTAPILLHAFIDIH